MAVKFPSGTIYKWCHTGEREGGCQKRDDITDRLRDMDSNIGERGSKIVKNCVTSYMDGPSFVINISEKT